MFKNFHRFWKKQQATRYLRRRKLAIRMSLYSTTFDYQYLFLSTFDITQGFLAHLPHLTHLTSLHSSWLQVFVVCLFVYFLVLSPFRSFSCLICLVIWFLCCQMCCINISTFLPTWSNTNNHENWISNVDPYISMKNTRDKAEKPKWCQYLSFHKGLISKSKIYILDNCNDTWKHSISRTIY